MIKNELMTNETIKRVHVVFMTHFDMGFTDLADRVLSNYIHDYIPEAIGLAMDLNRDGRKRFIWTLGAFLIDQYLKKASQEEVQKLKDAVARGDICWHGLAFTTHTELMDADLMNFNLSYGDRLDREFGRETIAAKLTDVPGHTKAMVPIMVSHGKQYLHIGVNASSMNPMVPGSFVWQSGDSEILVQYSPAYGSTCYEEGMEDVLEFVFLGDNLGIPTREEVLRQLKALEKKYPGAAVEASTLDAYAGKLWERREKLPVIREEIGDTWIHGIASDPVKVSIFRRLLSLKDQWKKQGKFDYEKQEFHGFMENLLMVCEHTWALDYKKHLFDFENWEKEDFKKARKENLVTEAMFTERNTALLHAIYREKKVDHLESTYDRYESSYEEQRAYLREAVRLLPEQFREEAGQVFPLDPLPREETWEEGERVHPFEIISILDWKTAFDGNGSVVYLEKAGRVWIQSGCFGRFSYETYGAMDTISEFYEYNHAFKENMAWSEADFSKPGLETVEGLSNRNYSFGVRDMRRFNTGVRIRLAGNPGAVSEYGCPERAWLTYTFGEELLCDLLWENKDANKMPEALWFDVNIDVENPFLWKMKIMDQEISPLEVVKGGNRRQHCTEKLVYDGADGTIEIRNQDSPLVSVGGRRLYGGCLELPDMKKGFSYCLFNNKWGTNFPMWCQDDCRFQYVLSIHNK
ncbi:DUF5054 domain-containing protein [Lacrimispora sp.]|uniref:DUF5054 domain-containing protein n=1 Tax=Lacrimispora sp. TaxID=2719234 RepID=UPI0028A28E35|nr:DUF5054 domain-containing protein [Lacrimispora sp.]